MLTYDVTMPHWVDWNIRYIYIELKISPNHFYDIFYSNYRLSLIKSRDISISTKKTNLIANISNWVKCVLIESNVYVIKLEISVNVFRHLWIGLPISEWGCSQCKTDIMTSSNGNIFRVTGPLCGEFTGHRWIAHTKASDAELWCFVWSASE